MINITRHTIVQFLKYSIVGFLNLLFGLAVFYIFYEFLFVKNYLIAFTASWALGILLTYLINFIWVFKPEDKLTFRRKILKYATVYICSYVVNIYLLELLVRQTGYHPLILQMFILPIVVVINFLGFKYWALAKPVEQKN